MVGPAAVSRFVAELTGIDLPGIADDLDEISEGVVGRSSCDPLVGPPGTVQADVFPLSKPSAKINSMFSG